MSTYLTAKENVSGSVVDDSLPAMALRINHYHHAAESAALSALEHAHTAGELLKKAKALCAHGTWQQWCKANFDGSARTAQVYMRLADHWKEIEPKAQHAAGLSCRQALKLIGRSVPKPVETQAKPVNDIFPQHDSPYRIMPPMTLAEYSYFKADIAEHGVMVPVEYDQEGNILDGFHRVKACQELGIKDYPNVVRYGLSEEEKINHILSLNMVRTHDPETAEQLRAEDADDVDHCLPVRLEEVVSGMFEIAHESQHEEIAQLLSTLAEQAMEGVPTGTIRRRSGDSPFLEAIDTIERHFGITPEMFLNAMLADLEEKAVRLGIIEEVAK